MKLQHLIIEQFRKAVVTLKRRTHYIPLVMLSLCCGLYTFNLTAHSNAAMYVGSRTIAIYVFIITLTSVLVVFSFINAYSPRAKRKPLMLAVVYILAGVQVFLDIVYLNIIKAETVLRDNPVPITEDIVASSKWTTIHLVAICIALAAIMLLPVYRKLLHRFYTDIQDDEMTALLESEEKLTLDDEDLWA